MAGKNMLSFDYDNTCDNPDAPFLGNEFYRYKIVPELALQLEDGAYLSFITANSAAAQIVKAAVPLLDYLVRTGHCGLAAQIDFVSSAAGLLVSIPPEAIALDTPLLPAIAEQLPDGTYGYRPELVVPEYLESSRIASAAIPLLIDALTSCLERYEANFQARYAEYASIYDLTPLFQGAELIRPALLRRTVHYAAGEAVLALTLSPVCSRKLLRHPEAFESKDLRACLIEEITASLTKLGLASFYDVRAGGRYSIDITKMGIDKRWALESIIHRRKLEGDPRLGQHFGSRTVYFGDEVYPGGNDYPVVHIPGILVVAVNHDQATVPSLPNVVATHPLTGPQATYEVLQCLNSHSSLDREHACRLACKERFTWQS